MRVRDMKNLPLFYQPTARVVGRVERGVIGDDLRLAYVIVRTTEGESRLIRSSDITLTPESVIIYDMNCMKSYLHGEELSVYQKKLGDRIYDSEGREMGVVSDFLLAGDQRVEGLEVSSGILSDLLRGRSEIPIDQVNWKSITSGLMDSTRE